MNDTWITTFMRMRIEVVGGATNAKCAWFRFVDSCTFIRCHLDDGPESTAVGAVFDATGSDLYPGGISFYDCSIKTTQVIEDPSHKIGKMYFYGHGLADGEDMPTHPNLIGITDDGQIFGNFLYNNAWVTFTPTVTLSGGSGNVVPQYVNNRARYKKIGKTVHFMIHLDGVTGDNGAGTGVVNVALPFPVKNDSGYYAEILGRVVDTASSYVAFGRILPGGTAMPIRHLSGTNYTDVTGAMQSGVRTIAITGAYECE